MVKSQAKADYDTVISDHYRKVAKSDGLSSSSTMADKITRSTETEAIKQFVAAALERRKQTGETGPATIMDVGCGNGYTLETLSEQFPGHEFLGVEKTDELRALAISRFESNSSVDIIAGDIRDSNLSQGCYADILICQRVVINLLDPSDQKDALRNITEAVKVGGAMLFVECFESSLSRLNEARSEFELEPIPSAYHNLYLEDGFFDVDGVSPHSLSSYGFDQPSNFLSTHFYVTRVLHPMMTKGQPVKRNSEFVNFFSSALKPAAGDYAPLKLVVLDRV